MENIVLNDKQTNKQKTTKNQTKPANQPNKQTKRTRIRKTGEEI